MEHAARKDHTFDIPKPKDAPLYADRIPKAMHALQEAGLDVRLVGSFGRAAAIRQYPHATLTKNKLSDIDFIVCNNPDSGTLFRAWQEASSAASPILVDHIFKNNVHITGNEASISYKDISLPVDPVVFQPVEGLLLGNNVPTLDPNTLLHLTALYGHMRPKDLSQLMEYRRFLRQGKMLPEELFEPFHALYELRAKHYPHEKYLDQLAWIYNKHLPEGLRDKLRGVVTPIRRHHKGLA